MHVAHVAFRVPSRPFLRNSKWRRRLFSATVHRQGRRLWSFHQALWQPPVDANLLQVQSTLHPPLLGSAPVDPFAMVSRFSMAEKDRTTLSLIPRLTGGLFLPRAPVF